MSSLSTIFGASPQRYWSRHSLAMWLGAMAKKLGTQQPAPISGLPCFAHSTVYTRTTRNGRKMAKALTRCLGQTFPHCRLRSPSFVRLFRFGVAVRLTGRGISTTAQLAGISMHRSITTTWPSPINQIRRLRFMQMSRASWHSPVRHNRPANPDARASAVPCMVRRARAGCWERWALSRTAYC